jgi:hypothetical protein
MQSENMTTRPRIIPRKGRGFLAISALGDRLQIGVTADTEAEAVSRFRVAAARWRELLLLEPSSSQEVHAATVAASPSEALPQELAGERSPKAWPAK